MSAQARNQPEQVLRWSDDLPIMEFKCGGCGVWQSFAHATNLKAGDAYICTTCADNLLTALGREQASSTRTEG